jgi:two-component system nitrate/nitrite response regulator NarL
MLPMLPDKARSAKGSRQGSAERTIRVVLLGEDRIARAGLRLFIDSEPGLKVVGEGAPLDDPGFVPGAQPDVVLLDIDRSDHHFVPSLITRLAGKTRVIVLTNASDTEIVSSIFWSGAKGLVRKDQAPKVLLKAIRKVEAGEAWLDRSTTARLLSELARGVGQSATEASRVSQLTLRERQLITVVGQGFTNGQIAERLHISEATVRNHLTSIFRKLELHSRFELVMYALRQGLIKAPLARHRSALATTRGARRIKNAS